MRLSDLYSPTALSGPVDLSIDQPRWDSQPLDTDVRRPDLEGLTGSDTFVHDMLLRGCCTREPSFLHRTMQNLTK